MKKAKRKLRKLPFTLVDEDDEEAEVAVKEKRAQNFSVDDDEYGLDKFETDGFIVDYNEEEVEGDCDGKDEQMKKKMRKKKSSKNLVLDDDDLELLRENQKPGLFQAKRVGNKKFKRLKKAKGRALGKDSGLSDDDVSLYDDSAEEKEAMYDDDINDMTDFIVDDDERYEKRAPVRLWELKEKKSRLVTAASSSSLEEAGYVFGDADELLKRQVLVKVVKPDDYDNFDPDHFMAERDDHVKKTDLPERMQMSEEITWTALVGETRRQEESSWILNQLITDMYPLLCNKKAQEGNGVGLLKKINKEDIVRFLEMHDLEKYDILWAINELDRKWSLLQKRKSMLEESYKKRYEEECNNIDDMARLSLINLHFDTIMKSLMLADTEKDIDDVSMKFSLHFPPTEEVMEGKFKRRERRSAYSDYIKAGLWELAVKFVCSSKQFCLHLRQEKMGMDFWEDLNESPEVIASKFMCASLETPEAVLKGARHIAALEISCEPSVRKHARGFFIDEALVSTRPTPKGAKEIDFCHQFSSVKWLRDKPLDKFQDAQWLLIQKAEEEKLLEVTIKLPEDSLNKLISYSHKIYLAGGDDGYTQLWDEQRKLILKDVFSNCLLPSLEKETRVLLKTRAKCLVLMEYGEQLWNRASVAPYLHKRNVAGLEEGTGPRVMACCWGPGKPPTTFVMLDSCGQLLDVLQSGSISLRSQNVTGLQRKKYDQLRVHKFIISHQPDVIVLGAANASCPRLKDDIKEIVLKIEESSIDADQVLNGIAVIYGDETLPQLYEKSEVSLRHLPGQEGIVKRAVALGRYLQNPLAMIATLCGVQKEIVSWKLTSLDHFLTPEEKYGMIEMLMVDITNQVGVDINAAVSQDWLSAPLQFVSGLGSRKAAFLQRELAAGKIINNRKELAICGLTEKKIFFNAVGFLRVCCGEILSFGCEYDMLDGTRIHPESYGLAEKLVKDVYDDVAEAHPLKHVKNNPQLLKDFDINAYADNYEIERGENKKLTLYDIKTELLHGFLDPRRPYEEPTQDEEFCLISGKNEYAFAEGRILQAIVCRVLSQRAFCALDSGLIGMITKDDYSDEAADYSLTKRLREGDILTCKIKQIDKSRHQVLLTCKESELKSSRDQNLHELEPYYCGGQSSLVSHQEIACKEDLKNKHFISRMIIHPHYENMTQNQAVEFLADKDVGERVFHPSSRGPHYLTLTVKVFNGLYVHKDIIEDGKNLKDFSSMLDLGKTLKIGDDIYKDLEEVISQYVDPLVTHLKAILSFHKFKQGSKAEVDELLKSEKSDYPMRIPYCFGVSYKHPGTFILFYIRTNLHHEYIGLHPKGFKFRKQTFRKVEQLVAYFQKHIDDLKHQPAQMTRPITGSSARASTECGNEGGWKGQLNSSKDELSTLVSAGKKDCTRDDGGIGGHGSGRGRGHPSGLPRPDCVRGNGNRGGFGNGRGGNNRNGSDSGNNTSYWDDSGGNSGARSSYSWGNNTSGNASSWGNNAGGDASSSSWGGSRHPVNAGGRNWGGSGDDCQGIPGSGPPNGSDWMGSNKEGGNNFWGTESSSGGNLGGFNTNSASGNTGWGAGSRKSSSHPAGEDGWSGGGG
ncbi:transcription elongation factor SPT6-like isoform X3 [Populus alba]|uniref:transcription elongation factor SPT6-like isoform X3 n=1 Tax=Populus alba TaxID=43335 RepID=UPI003CC72336